MTSKLITIITVTLNSEATLVNTIESILMQDYENIEYIIKDGCSLDNTIQIAKKYEQVFNKRNIKFMILIKKDLGIYSAMNQAIEQSSGSVIGILNSDDIYSDKSVISDVMKEFDLKSCDCVYGDIEFINTKKEVVRRWRASVGDVFKGWNPPHPSTFFSKKLYDIVGYYREDFEISSDYEFMIRAFAKHGFKANYLDRNLVQMLVGGESTRNIRSNLIGNIEVVKSLANLGFSHPIIIAFRRLMLKLNSNKSKVEKKPTYIFDNIVFSLQRSGGISKYWSSLVNFFTINNLQSEYMYLEYAGKGNNIFRNEISLNEDKIKYHKFPVILHRYYNPLFLSNERKIFHSSYYRIAFGRNIKNVVTLHDFIYEKYYFGILQKVHKLQKMISLIFADAIICVSENTRNDLIQYYPRLKYKRIVVIPNGVDTENFRYLGLPKKKQVVFVGSRAKYKNFNLSVEIVRKIESLSLIIVGDTLSKHEFEFLEEMLPNRYDLRVKPNNNDLNIIYNESICLLYLSDYEGFGIPILEAFSARCAVIAQKKSSIPEVSNGHALLFDNVEVAQISKVIENLMINPDVIDYELAEKYALKFTWYENYLKTCNLYSSLWENKNE